MLEKKGKQLGLINYQDFDKSQGSFFSFLSNIPEIILLIVMIREPLYLFVGI